MEQLELEGIAAAILREAGEDDGEPPKLGRVVRKLLGPDGLQSCEGLLGDGRLAKVHGGWRIYIRRKLAVQRKLFAVAHELVEWWLLVREDYRGRDIEACADRGAAALVAPPKAFHAALRAFGRDLPGIAGALSITESHAGMRLGEVLGVPLALVTPERVRTRGPDEWVWPKEETLRAWAARRAVPGLAKTRLRDDPRRVLLEASEG